MSKSENKLVCNLCYSIIWICFEFRISIFEFLFFPQSTTAMA